jgi:phosphoglycolate phosphatase
VLTGVLDSLRRKGRWAEVYAAFSRTELPLGTLEFLERISQEARLGVVTKSPRTYAEKLLAFHRMKVPVIAAYHDVKRVKPNPEALLLASQKLGIAPPRCIYVGDDANDVRAARSAGFAPVGVCWGARVNIGLESVCTSWDEAYDEIQRLITG